MALSWKLTAGSKESPHKGWAPLNHSNPAWSGLEKLPMYLMLCILFTVGLMEFPWFFGQLFQSTAWVSFSIFDCVDKTHPVGSVVLCRSSMLQLEYCTRPLDVLHRSWTMLMLDKKTIAVRPFAATLIPEPQGFLIIPRNMDGFVS